MPDVGILFVHGIGQQPKGDTLLGSAEPVAGWLDRWLRRRGGAVEILESRAGGPLLDKKTPAHALLRVETRPNADQTWLLAESWWAEEFRAPPFGRLAGWLLTRGAWLILSHAGRGLRLLRASGWFAKTLRFIEASLFFLLAIPLALLVQLLVVVLAAAALLPIQKLRKALSSILMVMTGTIGDSYVVVESMLQRGSATARLRHDIEWLHDQGCTKVIVAAHSQGGAIAHFTLRRPEPRVDALITFGSGLAKLQELLLLSSRDSTLLRLATFAVPVAALVAFFLGDLARAVEAGGLFGQIASLTIIGTVIHTVLLLVQAIIGSAVVRDFDFALRARPDMRWYDYYATADPVPHGCLTNRRVRRHRPREVSNYRHVIRDHNGYWQNEDEFIPLVLRAVDREADAGLFDRDELNELATARARHTFRTSSLLIARTGFVLAIVLTCAGIADELAAVGAQVLGWLDGKPLLDAVHGLLVTVGDNLRAILTYFGVPAEKCAWLGYGAVGSLLPATGYLLWHLLTVGPVWRLWAQYDGRRLLEKSGTDAGSRIYFTLTMFFVLLPLVMAGLTLFLDLRTSWDLFVSMFQLFMLCAVMIGIILYQGVNILAMLTAVFRFFGRRYAKQLEPLIPGFLRRKFPR